MHRVSPLVAFVVLVLTALAPRAADAQVRCGSIVVEVIDQSGGAVPGAHVTVTQAATGLIRSAAANEGGLATLRRSLRVRIRSESASPASRNSSPRA